MNNRIKELAEEASNGSDYELECVTDAFLQIFAEAIVWECVDLSLGSSLRDDDMGAIIASKIKRYFGVE
jgi:hypothetical protein